MAAGNDDIDKAAGEVIEENRDVNTSAIDFNAAVIDFNTTTADFNAAVNDINAAVIDINTATIDFNGCIKIASFGLNETGDSMEMAEIECFRLKIALLTVFQP